MKRLAQLALLFAVMASPLTAEVVDRAVAVVNGHLITWSDLDAEMRFEALENQRAPRELTADARRAAFEHLLQERLMRDQMQGVAAAEGGEIDSRIAGLRAEWKKEKDDAGWGSLLASYGLSASELRELVAQQIEVLHCTEFRLRPLARVTRREVEEYYSSTLAPAVMARGQSPDALAKVAPQIRELLEQQKMSRETDKWLDSLKAQGHIKLLWEGVR